MQSVPTLNLTTSSANTPMGGGGGGEFDGNSGRREVQVFVQLIHLTSKIRSPKSVKPHANGKSGEVSWRFTAKESCRISPKLKCEKKTTT